MKSDTQHLDFLISQYVDGCLEGASKKSVEQKMLTDPGARKLYTDHREVQDLLDDWGNRIPLIHWDEFDQKLAKRLEQETVGSERSRFQRWLKPMAAAAALFLAAGIGYSWNAWWTPKTGTAPTEQVASGPQELPRSSFVINDMPPKGSSLIGIHVDEAAATLNVGTGMVVAVDPPETSAAEDALMESLRMAGILRAPVAQTLPGTVVVGDVKKDGQELAPGQQ